MLRRANQLWARLTFAVPGARVVKSGVVVALVWAIAQALGQQRPMFAVFAALGAIQPTVRSSVLHLGGVLAGVIMGSLLALAMTSAFGAPEAATMALAVVMALVIGYRLAPSKTMVGGEVLGSTVLTVAFANGQPSWIAERLVEVASGGLLGVLVNAIVLPPDYLSEVRRAVHTLADELANGFQHVIVDLVERPPREVVRGHLTQASVGKVRADELLETTDKALEALHFSPMLRYSPFRRGRRERVKRYGAAVHTLATALEHMRTAQRAAWQARRRPALDDIDGIQWLPLGQALSEAIRSYEAHASSGDEETLSRARATMSLAFEVHARAMARHSLSEGGAASMDRSAILAEIEHALEALSEPLKVESPHTTAATRPVPILLKA